MCVREQLNRPGEEAEEGEGKRKREIGREGEGWERGGGRETSENLKVSV